MELGTDLRGAGEDHEVIPSFKACQNGLFFDPMRTLANGKPAMAFVPHEGSGWESVESANDLDYGQILLRMIADAIWSPSPR